MPHLLPLRRTRNKIYETTVTITSTNKTTHTTTSTTDAVDNEPCSASQQKKRKKSHVVDNEPCSASQQKKRKKSRHHHAHRTKEESSEERTRKKKKKKYTTNDALKCIVEFGLSTSEALKMTDNVCSRQYLNRMVLKWEARGRL